MVYFKQYFLLVGERPVCVFLLISVEVSVTGRYDCVKATLFVCVLCIKLALKCSIVEFKFICFIYLRLTV
jgi:hypothetical protein